MSAPRFYQLAVKDVRQETADCVSVSLAIPAELAETFRFAPGQYLTFRKFLEDGEVTLKRFYREQGGIRLQPANSTMDPIRVPRAEIRGVIIGVVRQY